MTEADKELAEQAEYEAGRVLHAAWYSVGRAIAPPFALIDKFDRMRWIETAKISNAYEREACAKVCETTAPSQINGYECAAAIRARSET